MQQTLTDRSLLADARDGSERAFELLVGPLVEPAYRFACGMLHDSQAAQDVVQEATLKAWRKLGTLAAEDKMRPWFLGIVANECRNARRLKWSSGVTLGLPELSERSKDEQVLRSADIRNALRRLNHDDCVVVVLFFYLDMPLDEVARVTGSSPSAARSRLYRSIRRMRPDMEIEEALR